MPGNAMQVIVVVVTRIGERKAMRVGLHVLVSVTARWKTRDPDVRTVRDP